MPAHPGSLPSRIPPQPDAAQPGWHPSPNASPARTGCWTGSDPALSIKVEVLSAWGFPRPRLSRSGPPSDPVPGTSPSFLSNCPPSAPSSPVPSRSRRGVLNRESGISFPVCLFLSSDQDVSGSLHPAQTGPSQAPRACYSIRQQLLPANHSSLEQKSQAERGHASSQESYLAPIPIKPAKIALSRASAHFVALPLR